MSSSNPMREGRDFRYQMWATGLASSMCPMRSLRTFARVTSTPHFSADDAAVLETLVLAAQAFVVLDRPEDLRAEQTVTLRLETYGS